MEKEDKTLFEIDRAVKVLLREHPETFLDLFFGRDRNVVFQGVEDPQVNIPERRADKVWLIADQGENAALHIEAMLEPDKRELANFKTKNALLEETLKRPVVTIIVYLEKGRYETFPYIYETQAGLFKNTLIFARILIWEHKERISNGELKELAPFLLLCEDELSDALIERVKKLIYQVSDERERRNLFSVAYMVAYRKAKDRFPDKNQRKAFVQEKFFEFSLFGSERYSRAANLACERNGNAERQLVEVKNDIRGSF
ncbi:hypothetical protein L0337_37420 [candidate division KSB1 bacterium]|nr:hypothetical protein [candidate division KSB1 bacterium]